MHLDYNRELVESDLRVVLTLPKVSLNRRDVGVFVLNKI